LLQGPQRFSLVLDDVAAVGLLSSDQNGLADPYVQVHADFLTSPVESSIKKNTLCPSWNNEQIRVRPPHYARTKSYLDQAHLYIKVLDYDRFSRNDTMGCAVLSCRNLLFEALHGRASKVKKSFDLELTNHGHPCGRLLGRIWVDARALNVDFLANWGLNLHLPWSYDLNRTASVGPGGGPIRSRGHRSTTHGHRSPREERAELELETNRGAKVPKEVGVLAENKHTPRTKPSMPISTKHRDREVSV